MKINFNLNLVQSQKLVMTPELKQAIEILQYSALELSEFIEEELLNNPLLEKVTDTNVGDFQEDNIDNENVELKNERTEENEIDWKEVINFFEDARPLSNINYDFDKEYNYDNFVASENTLKDFLMMQLETSNLEKRLKIICEYIIENIDDNGYLNMENYELMQQFGISETTCETLIKFIQTFDPVGVGARTIKECLLIQLRGLGYEESLEEELVIHYLNDLAANRISFISKQINESLDQIQEAYDFIKTLEPKPGRSFSSLRNVRYITPDVYVEKRNDVYSVVMNEAAVPHLRINTFYKNLKKEINEDRMTAEYINKSMQSAIRFIRSIDQRRSTIYRVCEAVVNYQQDFFRKGKSYLKPLNLRDIADELDIHESTVSRAVSGKYMQCPDGLYEIKYFFQSGVKNDSGNGVSSESVKMIIKNLISSENSKRPYSDQYITNYLNEKSIVISRRTVAKYRDELGIDASSKRKRF